MMINYLTMQRLLLYKDPPFLGFTTTGGSLLAVANAERSSLGRAVRNIAPLTLITMPSVVTSTAVQVPHLYIPPRLLFRQEVVDAIVGGTSTINSIRESALMNSRKEYMNMKVVELRNRVTSRKIPVSSNSDKEALVDALLAADSRLSSTTTTLSSSTTATAAAIIPSSTITTSSTFQRNYNTSNTAMMRNNNRASTNNPTTSSLLSTTLPAPAVVLVQRRGRNPPPPNNNNRNNSRTSFG
jgi:hypothetical protein